MVSEVTKFDVAIVGGGILGLAHALAARDANQSVVLFERGHKASGASIRNFGMVWPVGQPVSEFPIAMKSRETWLRLKKEANIWAQECGSIHLAKHEDELMVLQEFVQNSDIPGLTLISKEDAVQKSAAVNPENLLGALWSPHELCVNPKTAIHQIAKYLVKQLGVTAKFGSTVTHVSQQNEILTSDGSSWKADRVVICSGADFETLFPDQYQSAGLKKCKLQMLSTVKQENGWRLGPHIAGGLTLRHYHSFRNCPSLKLVRERIANEQPELDRFGIHVMASMNDDSQVILGDSHLYGDEITPFDSSEIDNLILQEIKKLISLPNFKIQCRWHGVYAKHPSRHIVEIEPHSNCKIVTAPGGAGMTLSFGIADQIWKNWA